MTTSERTARRAGSSAGLALLTALALVDGACKGDQEPHVMHKVFSSKTATARMLVRKLAVDAYPAWLIKHPASRCPSSVAELGPYMDDERLNDPWGTPLVMMCGDAAPAAANGFGVVSYGADGRPGGDGDDADIDSWTPD